MSSKTPITDRFRPFATVGPDGIARANANKLVNEKDLASIIHAMENMELDLFDLRAISGRRDIGKLKECIQKTLDLEGCDSDVRFNLIKIANLLGLKVKCVHQVYFRSVGDAED